MIKLTVNTKSYDVEVEPDMPLLWVLRDVLHFTGTKFGCGMALCGACTCIETEKLSVATLRRFVAQRATQWLQSKDFLRMEAIPCNAHG